MIMGVVNSSSSDFLGLGGAMPVLAHETPESAAEILDEPRRL